MTGHDEWRTPPKLFEVLNEEFDFDFDAAASHENTQVGAWFLSREDNALKAPWRGLRVWCNPPYTLIGPFVFRAWQQCQEQHNTIVLLIPAYTDPAYWWDCIVPYADEIRFLRGRVSFLEFGQKKESARFPSVVVVFRWRAGIAKGFPRVWWWDWKAETDPAKIAPLFAGQADQVAVGRQP